MIKLNRKSCFISTGCFGDRDPRLQPDDLAARRGTHSYSSANETFLPQLRIPASPTAFLSVTSPPTSSHHAILHSGPWGAPRLLQHPYDTAEWTGGRKDNATNSVFALFLVRVFCFASNMCILYSFLFVCMYSRVLTL